MFREEEITPLILALLPEFKQNIDKLIRRFDELTPCDVMSELSSYVDRLIRDDQLHEFQELFVLVERCMVEGEPSVKNAAATCFLENLQNMGTPTQAWVPLLGPESKDYCRAWDSFTGAQTDGLD